MIWKTILSSYESKISEYGDNQNIINLGQEIGISLEIILNVFKRSTVSVSTENLISNIYSKGTKNTTQTKNSTVLWRLIWDKETLYNSSILGFQ